MQIKLLNEEYKVDEQFYKSFLEDNLRQSEFVSDEFVNIPEELPDFQIYFANIDKTVRESEYLKTIRIIAQKVINLDRDIVMEERFWHSWLCLYKREYLVEKYK